MDTTPTRPAPGDLPAAWRQRAQFLSDFGDPTTARLWLLAAAELERALEAVGAETLSLAEAARVTGYTPDHLSRLITRGSIPNAGRRGAPRIRRADLPQKNPLGVAPGFPLNLHAHLHRLVVPDVVLPVQEPPRLAPTYLPKMEQDEYRLRERRSYREVAGTEAARIIAEAGLRPFPPLTAAQREILAERQQPRRVDPVVAQAAAEIAALPRSASVHGLVHRG